jgi:hypothetical protein
MSGYTVDFIDPDHKVCRRSDTGRQFPFEPGNPDFTQCIRIDGKTPNAYVAPSKTGSDVNVERDRRILAGTVINVTGHGSIPVTGTKDDKDVFLARRIVAASAAENGVTAPVFVFRDRENSIHNLTPLQMVELADKGFSWIEAMMVRSWAMKDGASPYEAGIPDDLEDDSHWPTPA